MKKMLIVAAVVATASPVFAQSYDPAVGSGNVNGAQAAPQQVHGGAEAAFARVVPATRRPPAHAARRAVGAYDEAGHMVGADPDANIRFQLRRDADSIQGF